MRDTLVAGSANNGITVTAVSHAGAVVDHSSLLFNGATGASMSGAQAILLIGGSTISGNNTGVAASGGATLQSFKNNQIAGNNADGTPITAVPGVGGPLQ